MTIKIQMIIIVILLVALVAIISMVRKRELDLKYVIAWMICDFALVILTLFPDFIAKLANLIGIQSPMNMLFFLGFVFSLFIIFSLTTALSRLSAQIRKISQEMALLEEKLRKEK